VFLSCDRRTKILRTILRIPSASKSDLISKECSTTVQFIFYIQNKVGSVPKNLPHYEIQLHKSNAILQGGNDDISA